MIGVTMACSRRSISPVGPGIRQPRVTVFCCLKITEKPERGIQGVALLDQIFGMPSLGAPGGWRIDGHHLNVNSFR
jgi:hypothetical protein